MSSGSRFAAANEVTDLHTGLVPNGALGCADANGGELGPLGGGEAFGWDNEFEAHTVEVPAFSVGQYKVTNGEYLEFVRQGADV